MKSVFASKYVSLRLLIVIFVILTIGGVVFFAIKHFHLKNENVSSSNKTTEEESKQEKKTYEVLVAIRNQYNPDPKEDKRVSMKKGYVLGVYNDGHKWSETEKRSYLILKMNLTEKQKNDLVQPIKEKKNSDKKGNEKKGDDKIDIKEGEEENIIGIRMYKIDLEKIGFSDPKVLTRGQPFKDKVFDWDIVKKVSE